jgi:hypothetical protein
MTVFEILALIWDEYVTFVPSTLLDGLGYPTTEATLGLAWMSSQALLCRYSCVDSGWPLHASCGHSTAGWQKGEEKVANPPRRRSPLSDGHVMREILIIEW